MKRLAIALGNRIAFGFTPSGTPIATEVVRGVSICANIDEVVAPWTPHFLFKK